MSTAMSQQDMLYLQLLDASRQACALEQYAVAYHALAAAMHRARYLKSSSLLQEVLQKAQTQQWDLNTSHPENHLSSLSASARGHVDVYHSLMRQIETSQTQLSTEQELLRLQKSKAAFTFPENGTPAPKKFVTS